MARRSLASRVALFGLATAIALVAAELVFRVLRPDTREYQPGNFYTPDGTVVPIAEIANFLTGGAYLGGTSSEHPRGRLTPGLRVKQSYDRPRWAYFDAQGSILIEHNSLGFRDEEFPIQKPAGELRVLALGDSFTYGSGVLQQDSWPQVVERRLREDGATAQVINCGFASGSYTPAGYDTWMVSDGLLLAPDLVIVGFCLNDTGNGNDVPMLSYKGVMTCGYASALIDFVATTSHNRAAKQHPPDFARIVREHPKTWNATQDALRSLQRIVGEKKIPLVVAVFPMLSQLDRDPYPYEGLHVLVNDFCRDHNIPCVDLKAAFLGKDETELWVHPTDQHPNDVAQRWLGEGIFAFLKRENLTRAAR